MELLGYLFLGVIVFLVNMMPGFMPATWTILAFFTVKDDLVLIPTVLIGAVAAVSGRIVLYYITKHYLRRFFPAKSQQNYQALRNYLSKREKWTLPFIFAYAFSPIPSNQLFIIAGLTNFNIKILASSFFIGRLMSYTLWVGTAHALSDNLEAIFTHHLSRNVSIVLELVGFSLIFLLGRIDWAKLLKQTEK
ncbi:MAG: hypothetical protein Q8Q24_00665 [bacterium]|nr:hypothetical protein [bacterium]